MQINGLYILLEKELTRAKIQLTSEEHPIFKAHFPENPILPAFIHFEIVSEIFNITINNIQKAKFTEVIRPNKILLYIKKNNTFTVFCDTKKVASFKL
ncbi:hypothetical protein JHD48_03160 [Sulfurimonas sp. SAG-AH-194-I05]|nr:hypothetical protein [Sulfurimonas sp. SAG-AH-194-I05]MDF1874732.1 hypothetical protein [Sulfurimonas sp. SAG-AH-194-I05]